MQTEITFAKKLSELLTQSGLAKNILLPNDPIIQAITIDSRAAKAGLLFCAYPGTKVDGRSFIENALKQGVSAVAYDPKDCINEAPLKEKALQSKIPFIAIPSLQTQVSKLDVALKAEALNNLDLIGVTGTNGKTSITHYLSQAFTELGTECGVLGTVGYGLEGKLIPLNLTTPDPITLIDCLVEMQQHGASEVAMEVSAHALTQGRVNGLKFKTAVFTNLTQDHLDYYGTMENYGRAKAMLFTWPQLQHAVVNLDDPFAATIIEHLNPETVLIGFSQNTPTVTLPEKVILAKQIDYLEEGYRCEISSSWGEASLSTQLIGRFNVSNLLATLGVLIAQGITFEKAIAIAQCLKPVAGRMQIFGGGTKPRVIVDYAHTPDALQKALIASREHLKGRLFCVFGCGGERDPLKRPIMARIAQQYADYVVITQDNPRAEPWQQIVDDIAKGLTDATPAPVIAAREEAIRHAISAANENDVVLVAGKGHENYQIIGGQQLEYDDRLWVQRILQEKA